VRSLPAHVGLAALAITAAAVIGASQAVRADSSPTITLTAFVAANATDPWNDIMGAFESQHPGVVVQAEYAGTQILETQAEQGAPFDIFLSADRAHIDKLHGEGLVGEAALVSQGHEVIIVPEDDPAGIHSLRDLGDKPAKLVLGTDAVPIGIYSRQVLANAAADYGSGFPAAVLSHAVSFETNVKQVLEKVALGEADAGIVYYTDVTPAYSGKVTIVPIPQRYEVEAGNYLAVAAHSQQAMLAGELAVFAEGPAGKAIFQRHGYDPIP
jgi:molybdenum ABC transporter molybdate-binding protein